MTELELAGQGSIPLTPNLEEILESAKRNSLTRDNPALSDLPEWFTELRDHQRVAVREILTAYEEGAECVVLDAPTGSGKTLIGETVRRLLNNGTYRQANNGDLSHRGGSQACVYVCSSKSLQDQFLRDYPYAKVLKGRSNYPTESYPERFYGDGLSAADCTKSPGVRDSCLWCVSTTECPYEQAKSAALRSDLAVVNTSYFLSECNGPGRFSRVDGGRGGFIIADEADTLEKELMSHVEVRISERRLKQYGLGTPRFVTKEESWQEWVEIALQVVSAYRPIISHDQIRNIREAKRHTLLVQRLKDLRLGLQAGGWVYTGDRQAVAFKPVTVRGVGQSKFWQHGDRFLLMSATVISADELLESLGWDEDRPWRLVKCPSTFPPENRKVVVWPVASMTYKERDESYPKIAAAVNTIVAKYPTDRILIHSTSYNLTGYLVRELLAAGATKEPCTCHLVTEDDHIHCHCPTCCHCGCMDKPSRTRPIISYSSASERDSALEDYLATPAAIMVAPSLDRGVDLPGDACRVQIICKVPFLNLKDKQVSGRLYGGGREGKLWYSVNAIRTIVQMTGRAVRSEEDWAVAYILDGQFVSNVWNNYKRLIPEWWREGLEWRMKGL